MSMSWRRGVLLAIMALAGGVLLFRMLGEREDPTAPMDGPPAVEKTETPADLIDSPSISASEQSITAPETGESVAIDLLLKALRSGDRKAILAALEELKKEFEPPPIPDEENGAPLYMQAFEKLSRMTEEEREISYAIDGSRLLTVDQRAVLQKFLDRNLEVLALLHEAAERPGCNFGVNYSDGIEALIPHLSPTLQAARLLEVESTLAEGDDVVKAARAMAKLADAMADEPIGVSQMVRSICHLITAKTRERAFAFGPDVVRDLVGADPGSARIALRKVLAFDLYSAVNIVMEEGDLARLASIPPDPEVERAVTRGLDHPERLHDLAYLAEAISEAQQLVELPYHDARGRLESWRQEWLVGAPQYGVVTRIFLTGVDRMARGVAGAEASLNGARIAAELGDYRSRTGAYPVFLEDLRVELPVDPFTGKPYHYRREGSGFVVYSVGEDGDDGGHDELDVVFRSPQ